METHDRADILRFARLDDAGCSTVARRYCAQQAQETKTKASQGRSQEVQRSAAVTKETGAPNFATHKRPSTSRLRRTVAYIINGTGKSLLVSSMKRGQNITCLCGRVSSRSQGQGATAPKPPESPEPSLRGLRFTHERRDSELVTVVFMTVECDQGGMMPQRPHRRPVDLI